jgi:hypothetical protein
MRNILLATVATAAMSFAMTGGAKAQPVKAPAPGTIVVNLNGNFTFAVGMTNNPTTGSAAKGTLTKYSSIDTVGLFRLYPGFDAMTLGGLQYGVASELRDTSAAPNGAGVGSSSTSANGSVNLYVRRAYGYVGSADSGFLRFGQGDGAFSLMSYGDIESFGDGQQFNGDGSLVAILPAGSPNNLFAATGKLYTTSKVVYLSPSFAGLNFGISFEPNSNGIYEGLAGASAQSEIAGGSNARRRNTIDFMVGYTAKVDAAVVKLSAGYFDASPLAGSPTATTYALNTGTGAITPTAGKAAPSYKNMGIVQVGGQVAIAGAALGVNYKAGSVNDGYTFLTVGQRHDSDLLFSGTYTMGPAVVGASYFFNQSAGSYAPGKGISRTETNNGVAVGANYTVAKNFVVFTQYLYGQVKQNGAATPKSHSNAIDVGAVLKW